MPATVITITLALTETETTICYRAAADNLLAVSVIVPDTTLVIPLIKCVASLRQFEI